MEKNDIKRNGNNVNVEVNKDSIPLELLELDLQRIRELT